MSGEMGFSFAHVTSIAARAAELEQLGEERQDPHALIRAARLYTLAVRIADDIENREALPFMQSDLARVRDELRTLATDAALGGAPNDRGLAPDAAANSRGSITRTFREIAARIEQRLAQNDAVPDGANRRSLRNARDSRGQ